MTSNANDLTERLRRRLESERQAIEELTASELERLGENCRRVARKRAAYHRARYGGGNRSDARAAAQGLAPAPSGRPEPLARHLRRELGDDALAVGAHPGPDRDGRRPRPGHRGGPPGPWRS